MRQLVLASNNSGKLRELAALLEPFDLELKPQSAFAITEIEEPHPTFIENALAKARHAARASGLPALADDSGLCVAALAGAPGVHSAYYAGKPRSDERNNAHLLEQLEGISERRAHYVCVLVLLRYADDPQPVIVDGEWHGEIVTAPRGEGGFGYDPLFYLPELEQTAAELPAELKNTISHRGAAIRHLAGRLPGLTL